MAQKCVKVQWSLCKCREAGVTANLEASAETRTKLSLARCSLASHTRLWGALLQAPGGKIQVGEQTSFHVTNCFAAFLIDPPVIVCRQLAHLWLASRGLGHSLKALGHLFSPFTALPASEERSTYYSSLPMPLALPSSHHGSNIWVSKSHLLHHTHGNVL